MLEFLFKKKPKFGKCEFIKNNYLKVKELFNKEEISFERKKELGDLIEKFGYLPYSQAKALEELSPEETLFCLEKKLEINETYKDGGFKIEEDNISAVKRLGFTIKLINLAGLGNGTID